MCKDESPSGDVGFDGVIRGISNTQCVVDSIRDSLAQDGGMTHQHRARYSGWMAAALMVLAGTVAAIEDAPAPARPNETMSGEVRVALDGAFAPISAAPDGRHAEGYAVDLMALVAQRAGLKQRLVPKPTFADALAALRAREVDVVVAAARNEERKAYASFVGPYYSAQAVIVTRLDGGWNSIAALAGRTLAIDRSHYLIETLRREAPQVRVVEYDTVPVAMRAVAQGDADAMVTNIEVAARLINSEFLGRLQVSGVVSGSPSELYLAVRSDQPELAARLAQGLAQVSEAERSALAARWLRTTFVPGVPWTTILTIGLPILAAMLAIIAVVGAYNRRLRAEIQRRDVAEAALAAECDAAREQAAAKADFLSTMGHEIRTPLAAISGGIDLLRVRAEGADQTRLIERMQRASQYLVALLNDILDYAKLDGHRIALAPSATHVARAVEEVVEEFEPLARIKGVDLRFEGASAPPVMIDAMRLRQVVANLIGNALKFTIEGGVTVTYAQTQVANRRARIVIGVADSGIGIASSAKPALFERFSRVHEATRDIAGTGLGLAIVREITQMMGGRIEVDSRVGVGSTFTVSCEVDLADAQVASAPASASVEDTLQGRRILLVEDDPLVRFVLAEQMQSMGCTVQAVESAEEGMRRVHDEVFDAVVTDLQLAGMDGTALARAIHARRASADDEAGMARPVLIACSGDHSPRTVQACLQAGFDAYLAKPATMAELRALLSRLLDRGRPATTPA